MTVTIKINCDNAAFYEQDSDEVARILRETADGIELLGLGEKKLLDINGNHVGDLKLTSVRKVNQ